MLSLRAPLFFVSLAFATGCLLGLDDVLPLRLALLVFGVVLVLWFFLHRFERASVAAFYVVTIFAGFSHALLIRETVSQVDLRRLPAEKALATTQWRIVIIEEPVEQLSTRITKRTLDRTSFVASVQAWRPTEGRLFVADMDIPWRPAEGRVRCTLLGPAKELQCGDTLEFATELAPVAPTLCPGQLDYPAWEAASGIYYHATIQASNWRRVEAGGGNWWQNLSFRARDWAYGRLQIGLEDDPRMADFLAGMLIGYRQQIPTDIEQDFRRTGTLHVFAVSGQNIAEMMVVAMLLLQLCGLVRWRWAWTIAPIVLLYCLLTGSPASAIRATVMALAVLLAWRLGRPLNALGCWSLAFLAMLIWNPSILLDAGAQLSFGVVLGIILIAPPLARLLARPFHHDSFVPASLLTPAQTVEEHLWWAFALLLASGIAATLVSEPITAIAFHQVTPISIFANLLVVPMAGFITVIGTLSVAVSLFATPLAALFNNANWLLARGLILFVHFLAHHPGASLNVADLRAIKSPTPSLLVAPWQDTAGLLVRAGGQNWLINTGRESPTPSAAWRLLQFYGINRLDGLVLAQMSVADNGGAEALVRDFRPRRLIVPSLSTRSTVEKSMPELAGLLVNAPEPWQSGSSFVFAPDVSVEVLSPAADSTETHAEDRGLVLLFHVANQTLLWAGKIDAGAQAELLADHPGLRADVLVMGIESPPSQEWLEALGIRDWLQIPPRDRQLNFTRTIVAPDSCQLWPLDETGAVDIHFKAASAREPAMILLQPWVSMPVAR